jgi:prepilin-type N-terminal cleavage/methylation domain-containing protein
MKTHRQSLHLQRGYTLLEIVIAMSVFVIIIGGVFAIADGTLKLSGDMAESMDRALIRQNFVEYLRSSFRRLPAEAELKLEKGSGRAPASITVFNGGDAFSPGEAIPPDGSVELFAKEMPGGAYTVGLRMLDGDQTNSLRTSSGRSLRRASGNEVLLPLVEDVEKFEWEFYDATRGEWMRKWEGLQRPNFARVEFAIGAESPSQYIFWIPPILRNPANGVPGQPGTQLGPDGQPIPGQPNGQPLQQQQVPLVNPNANPNLVR